MSKTKRIILGLGVVAAFSVIGVATAWAAEFVPASGTLTGKNTATALGKEPKMTTLNTVITCTGDTISGTISGAMEVTKINISFAGCKAGAVECENDGTKKGIIKTKELKAVLGLGMKTTSESPGVVGLLFSAGTPPSAEFKCAILTIKLIGRVFCTISPTGVKGTKYTLTCKAVGSTPEYTFYLLELGESIVEVKLERESPAEKVSQMTEDEITSSVEGEIKV